MKSPELRIAMPSFRRGRRLRLSRLPARRPRPARPDRKGDALLAHLARRAGIQTEYVDMTGRTRRASPETLRGVLQLWGIKAGTPRETRDALSQTAVAAWRRVLEPVIICWTGERTTVELNLPGQFQDKSVLCRIHYEDGRAQTLDGDVARLRTVEAAALDGRQFVRKELRLPPLPFGYHELEVAFGFQSHRALLISAPIRSYSPSERLRIWGAFLPLYAARSSSSWGAGTLADWRRLTDWIASLGGRMTSTLPLLSAFLGQPSCQPSPYSPATRLFWNDFYLDIESTPEFQLSRSARRLASSSLFQERIGELRGEPLVDYAEQQRLRRRVLERMAADFFSSELSSRRHRQFRKFLEQRPAVKDYAEFRATCDQQKSSWHCWDERLRHGKLQKGDFSESVRNYHLFCQWLMEDQFCSLVEYSRRRGMLLQLDLPVGINPDGYDLWRERDAFAFPASAGAPPDAFFSKGQNWGFPPLHPERIRQQRYSHVLEFLRFQMRHAGGLRLDHVMGLHRLYWIPPGFPPTEGAYVSYHPEEFYAILSLESHRQQTVLVGENLGTVPPEVNASLARHDLHQTYVIQYRQRPEPSEPLEPPQAKSLGSINTHDMPTFRAHWEGLDIEDRAALGLLPKDKVPHEKRRRQKLNSVLARFLIRKHWLDKNSSTDPAAVLRAALKWLAASPAEMVQVNLEDLWNATESQNVPGTSTERPNWQSKTALSLEQILSSEEFKSFLASLTRLRQTAKEPQRPTTLIAACQKDPGVKT